MVVVTAINTYEELTSIYLSTAEKFRNSFQSNDIETTQQLSEQLILLPQCHVLTVNVETD